MRKPLLALIGVAVVGVVAWWFFVRSPSRSSEPKPAARTEAKTTAVPAQPQDRAGDRDTGPMPVLVDDDPKGALRLEGQVVDADDKPVAGAVVVLSSNPPRTTKSEEDGGFAFDALVGRPYTLT